MDTLLALTCLSVVAVTVPTVAGVAMLEIKLLEYRNSAGQDDDGKKCDIFGDCDHALTFCLDHFQVGSEDHKNHDTGVCHYWREYTDRLSTGNTNNFRGKAKINSVPNPLTQIFAVWPGRVMFKVKITDHDRVGADDGVDKMYKALAPPRAKSRNHASWIPLTLVGHRSRSPTNLEIAVRLYCYRYYYGLDCGTRCQPADSDRDGHYTCDSETGAKVCLPEWESPEDDCLVLKDDCVSQPCVNGGVCVDMSRAYRCVCPDGYTGMNCEVEIDHCASEPCVNGGTCSNQSGSYVCVCPQSYVGTNCQLHICEVEAACEHGGTCVGEGECYCAPGYTGARCETDLCDLLDCQHGGVCRLGQCLCPKDYTGVECESLVDLCEQNSVVCVNGGTCVNGTCMCPTGYLGNNCEGVINHCLLRPCLNDGTCYSNNQGYICDCAPQYEGRNCTLLLPDDPGLDLGTPAPWTIPAAFTQAVTEWDGNSLPDVGAVKDSQDGSGFPWWIYLAIGAGALLLVALVVIAVLVAQYRKKKKQLRAAQTEGAVDSPTTIENPVYHTENIYENFAGAAAATYSTSLPSPLPSASLADYATPHTRPKGAHDQHGNSRLKTPPGGLKTPKHLEERYKAMRKASAGSLKN